jgi:hypothetical protein
MRGLISAVLLLAPALASAAKAVPEVDVEQEWNQQDDRPANGRSYNIAQHVYS